MTNADIRRIALEQSAIDAGCTPEDFTAGEIRTCISRPHPDARKYLKLPLFCDFISYGTGVVVSAESEEIAQLGRAYVEEHPYPNTFETPSLHSLTERFAPWNVKPYFMAEYFLPEIEKIPNLPCPYPTKLLTPPDFAPLYTPEWGNALVAKRKELDMLGVGAYDGDRLIGLAACSADCDTMWQIGIDVLPAYRRQGIAAALTSALTREILARDKVPFYCAAWSNIGSVKNAIASGFRPAWVHLTCIRTTE